MYPPTTSESSAGYSSSESSARPSRNRCRSPAATDSVEEDIDMDMLEDIKADATAIEVEDEVESSDRGTLEVGVDIDARIDIPDGMLMPDAVEHLEQVMIALVISISSDVSVESVGSSFPRVILIDSISVEVPVATRVGAAAFTSPVGVLELDTHSSSKADPS
nr:hypothetical protein [Tanacetum cinerariifolium]